MRMDMKFLRLLSVALFVGFSGIVKAQIVGDWHFGTSVEEQWNATTGRWNFEGLLDYGIDINLWPGAQINANAITTYMQHDEDYISTDPLVFSNLDAPSKLFRFSVLGLSQKVGSVTLFFGLRNTVPDYFAEDKTSVFFGSIHGIQPVISQNYDIATYPTAALSAQLSWKINETWRLQSTIYNCRSTDVLGEIFDYGGGVINMTSVNYHSPRRIFEIGAATGIDNFGITNTAIYGFDIEHFSEHFCLIGEMGYYFGSIKGDVADKPETCHFNTVLAAIYTFSQVHSLGASYTFARYDEGWVNEQLEINYSCNLGNLTIQPAFVLDDNNGSLGTFLVMRLSYGLSKS